MLLWWSVAKTLRSNAEAGSNSGLQGTDSTGHNEVCTQLKIDVPQWRFQLKPSRKNVNSLKRYIMIS